MVAVTHEGAAVGEARKAGAEEAAGVARRHMGPTGEQCFSFPMTVRTNLQCLPHCASAISLELPS